MPNKIIVITGSTSGIGAQTAVGLAKEKCTIYMLVRNTEKAEREKRNILVQARSTDVHIIPCDLADMKSVARAASRLKSELPRIDVLINNAGGIFNERMLTKDGFENTFAVNYLGHFLLTQSLMPLLEKGKARIINISSDAHKVAKPDMNDLQSERSFNSLKAYANAKLFNIYFAQSLAEKHADKGITAYSLHPGIVDTRFGKGSTGLMALLLKVFKPVTINSRQGAETTVFVATEPGIEKDSGKYFNKKNVAKTSVLANDATMRADLWDKSQALIAPFLVGA